MHGYEYVHMTCTVASQKTPSNRPLPNMTAQSSSPMIQTLKSFPSPPHHLNPPLISLSFHSPRSPLAKQTLTLSPIQLSPSLASFKTPANTHHHHPPVSLLLHNRVAHPQTSVDSCPFPPLHLRPARLPRSSTSRTTHSTFIACGTS